MLKTAAKLDYSVVSVFSQLTYEGRQRLFNTSHFGYTSNPYVFEFSMFLPRQIKPSITHFRKSCSSFGLHPENRLSQNKKTPYNVYNLNNKNCGRQLRSFTQQSENHLVTRKDSNEMTRELLQKLRVLKSSKQVHDQILPIIDKFMDTLVKHKTYVSSLPPLDPNEIFANVEISLEKIEVFGFDYDYTLASYTVKVQEFIYEHALQWMIRELGYPESLLQCKYDPTFAVRGLHYDTQKGNLIKLDYLGNIQLDAAFYGRQPLSIEQLSQQYPTLSVQKIYQEFLRPLSDLYCLPEACLISDIIQHFLDNNVHFDAAYIFEDVMKAKDYVHAGNIHRDIMNNLPSYLSKQPGLGLFLQRLKKEGKKIFLLTNSNYPFVNKGMEYILSDIPIRHWTDLFDVVMVSSRKPQWFNKNRPFRVFDTKTNKIKWERVNKFSEGEIYAEGSLESFSAITGWKGSKVIYFGDHIFNDLREPSIIQGWKTGVIIKELENEVRIQSSPEYKALLGELIEVDQLFARCQMHVTQQDPVLRTLKDHRDVVRRELKEMFNSTFGSMFRTHRNATMFAHGLQRYADIYTSNVENFLQKPMHYVFYPDRIYLPHELPIPSSKLFADHSKVVVPMEVDTLD